MHRLGIREVHVCKNSPIIPKGLGSREPLATVCDPMTPFLPTGSARDP